MPNDQISLLDLFYQMSGSSYYDLANTAWSNYGDKYSGVASHSLLLFKIGFILDSNLFY